MDTNTSTVAPAEQGRPRRIDAATRWRKLLEDQRVSGLPISAFCRERGIPASSLFAWRRRLAAAASGNAQTFKPVTIVKQARPRRRSGDDDHGDAAQGAIELRLRSDARRLLVRRGFDRQLLLDVIRALESLA